MTRRIDPSSLKEARVKIRLPLRYKHLPVSEGEAEDYTFGELTQATWAAFCEGWAHRVANPLRIAPEAKQVFGDDRRTQDERVSWEKGWLACDAVRKRFVQEAFLDEAEARRLREEASGAYTGRVFSFSYHVEGKIPESPGYLQLDKYSLLIHPGGQEHPWVVVPEEALSLAQCIFTQWPAHLFEGHSWQPPSAPKEMEPRILADAALYRLKEVVEAIDDETEEYSYEGDAVFKVKALSASYHVCQHEVVALRERLEKMRALLIDKTLQGILQKDRELLLALANGEEHVG